MEQEAELVARTVGTLKMLLDLEQKTSLTAVVENAKAYVEQIDEIRSDIRKLNNPPLSAFYDSLMEYLTLLDQIPPSRVLQLSSEIHRAYKRDLRIIATAIVSKIFRKPENIPSQHLRLKELLAFHQKRIIGYQLN